MRNVVHQRQLRESSKPHNVLTISVVAFLEKDIVNTKVRKEDGILFSCQKSLKTRIHVLCLEGFSNQ